MQPRPSLLQAVWASAGTRGPTRDSCNSKKPSEERKKAYTYICICKEVFVWVPSPGDQGRGRNGTEGDGVKAEKKKDDPKLTCLFYLGSSRRNSMGRDAMYM